MTSKAQRIGSIVAVRSIRGIEIRTVQCFRVVHDDADHVAVYIGPGYPVLRPNGIRGGGPTGRMTTEPLPGHTPSVWGERHRLLLYRWGAHHAVSLFWDAEWRPEFWYVDVLEPWRRFNAGYDTRDLVLDVVIAPDLSSWHLKDEAELDWAVAAGVLGEAVAGEVREEAARVMAGLTDPGWPFRGGSESWRPPPAWDIPEMPAGWDAPPGSPELK